MLPQELPAFFIETRPACPRSTTGLCPRLRPQQPTQRFPEEVGIPSKTWEQKSWNAFVGALAGRALTVEVMTNLSMSRIACTALREEQSQRPP
ncbi:hypothetical protein L596_030077 [Steinernema carpocapsae]|uniref:Uncharacterized protein n=1 Tax=Steinernema carpocapsae TaxID=34508 RepID=A0A4U5LRN2_STECR|nr:hypothetical protein L596_030077 [Steinernema carpocapsae]